MITFKKTISLLPVLVVLACCKTEHQKIIYDNDLSKLGLKIEGQNRMILNEESCMRIFFESSKYKIERAYINCFVNNLDSVNLLEKKVNSCHSLLFVTNDTVGICITPTDTGYFDFERIKLLFTDKEQGVLHILDTTIRCYATSAPKDL